MSKNFIQNLTAEIPQMGAAALLMGLPGMIEASEAAGQAQLVNSDILPVDTKDKAAFEAWGVKFGEPVKDDPLFVNVELPAGWTKRATDHSMHSDLVDEKGHKRAGIFYKAAFYDRSAHMYADKRLYATQTYDEGETQYGIVKTSDELEIYRTEGVVLLAWSKMPPRGTPEAQAFIDTRNAAQDSLRNGAKQWLADNYPDYENPLFYWDLDVENGEKPLSWFEDGPFDGDEEWDRIRFEFLTGREDGTTTLDEYAPRFPKYAKALRQFVREFDDIEEGAKHLEAEDIAAGRDPNAVSEMVKRAYKRALERIGMDAATVDEAAAQIVVQEPYKCLGCETMIDAHNLCEESGKKNGEAMARGENYSSNYGMDAGRF